MNRGLPEQDRHWAAQALALASLGDRASPNPRVGCVVVRDGRVVGRGWHRVAGEAHAEALALAEAGESARGATVFVNLEPCAHHGRTPPCAGLLIGAGVTRVVASMQDPNPRVDGKGFEELRRAGVQVDVGELGGEAERLNAPFLIRHREGRPLVTVKAAASLDGRVSAAGGRSRWISGTWSRQVAHRMRYESDAVLVGGSTVRVDNPRLDVRLEGLAGPRLRCVISRSLDIDPGSKLFAAASGSPVVVYTSRNVDPERARALEPLAEVVMLEESDGVLDLHALLDDLVRRDVLALLVEGGGRTIARFVERGLADRLALFVAPLLIGASGARALLDRPAVAAPSAGWRLTEARTFKVGGDLLYVGGLSGDAADGRG